MYQVCIYNNEVETGIHYPTSDTEAPHLNSLLLKEGLSMVDSLSFILYPNNPGFNSAFELTTKVKTIDIRDNSIRFVGRILNAPEKMDSNGLFYKEVTCEGAMSYLNDSRQRANTFATTNPTDFLVQILAIHNSKVDSDRQIQVGNVDVTGSVAYTCNFGTTLAEILAVKEDIGGDIRVRETDGVLYLDWLESFSSTTIDVALGINMKDMVKDKDVTSFGTRIIPLGANNLTISSINGGLDYIEDINTVAIYGVIEKPVEYREIEDPQELYNTCLADLSNYTQPLYLLEASALDLSCLSGNKAEQFTLGVNLHIYNPVMAVDSIYKAVLLDLDLLKPYNPKLTIANAPIKLTTAINDLRKSSIQNNGVYNNVQIGDSFGIRAVRSDGKVITTVNATEGMSIENDTKKVLSLDENGDVVANDGTYNNITANNIKVENGVITGATIQTSETNSGKERLVLTLDEFNSYNAAGNLSFKINGSKISIYDNGNYVGSIYGASNYLQIDLPEQRQLVITEGGYNKLVYWNDEFNFMGRVNANGGEELATQAYVNNAISEAIDEHISAYHSTP